MAQFYNRLPKEIVDEFISTFSRIEWAMKESGKYLDRYPNGVAKPCWSCLKRKLGEGLERSKRADVIQAIAYLTNDPPKVQIKDVGKLVWRDKALEGASDGQKAISAIERVRNNLFHGGKVRPDSAAGRDEALLRSSLAILDECLKIDPDLQHLFVQPLA